MRILVGWDPTDYPEVAVFRKLGACDCVRYSRTFLLRRIQDYDVIVPNLDVRIGRDLLRKAKRLKILATPTTGQDHFDRKAALDLGIRIVSLNDDPGLINGITSTAEHTWLLILACARRLRRAFRRVLDEASWRNTDMRGRQLKGLTLGIIGYGRLGRMVEGYARAFGMRVLVHDIKPCRPAHGTSVGLAALLAGSDIVSLHAKWLPGQPPVIGAKALRRMKPGAVLVNTARGGLVDPKAVLAALRSGKLAGMALDVASREYQGNRLPADPLVRAARRNPDIIVTPHLGGATLDAHAIIFRSLAGMVRDRIRTSPKGPCR